MYSPENWLSLHVHQSELRGRIEDGGGGEVGALTKVILFPRGQNRIHSVRASFDSRGFYSMKYGNYATVKAGGWERPQIPFGNIFEIM